jgi:YggT family protein
MIGALVTVFDYATQILLTLIFVWAVMSWLISFEVINLRNRFVSTVWNMLNSLMRPLTSWIPRRVRYLGGVDIAPIILILIIYFLRQLITNIWRTGSLL